MGDKKWLDHLNGNVIPSGLTGFQLSTYLIALEGWRRGLDLKFHKKLNKKKNIRITYSLGDGKKTHLFSYSRGDLIPKDSIKICVNKDLTKEYLARAGINIPEGQEFNHDIHDDEVLNYAHKLGFPLVIKPSNGTLARGVITNIEDEKTFKEGLAHVRYNLNYRNVIVERYWRGEEIRVYVVDNKIVGAYKRIPANVIGDGVHNIKELINIKNNKRKEYPHLEKSPIKFNDDLYEMLKENGYSHNTIPPKGEQIFLSKNYSQKSGADSIDFTDEITDGIRDVAVSVSNAIPGLAQYGVDMIIDRKKDSGVILEVNSRANIGPHLFPMEGQARDIPSAIIDYYFPNTSDIQRKDFYFDFNKVMSLLKNSDENEFTITPLSIIKYNNNHELKALKRHLNKERKNNIELLKLKNEFQNKYESIKQSRTWRFTAPIRYSLDRIRRSK